MTEPEISVIMPVYNAEKYLSSCLESVLRQDFGALEVLAVNNGSCDGSAQILSKYADLDKRVRIFNIEKNQGVGEARNLALINAKGNYIAFCDADDFVPRYAYAEMYVCAEKHGADIVVGNYEEVYGTHVNQVRNISSRSKLCFEEYMRSNAIWNRLFRKEFINGHQLCFDSFNYGEDTLFIAKVYSYNPKVAGVKKSVYQYMIRTNEVEPSLARSRSSRGLSEYLKVEKEIVSILQGKITERELEKYVLQKTIYLRNYWWDIDVLGEKETGFKAFQKHVESLPGKLPHIITKRVFLETWDSFQMLTFAEYIAELPAFDAKERVREQYAEGEIGFRYIWLFFKAWLKYKVRASGKQGRK